MFIQTILSARAMSGVLPNTSVVNQFLFVSQNRLSKTILLTRMVNNPNHKQKRDKARRNCKKKPEELGSNRKNVKKQNRLTLLPKTTQTLIGCYVIVN